VFQYNWAACGYVSEGWAAAMSGSRWPLAVKKSGRPSRSASKNTAPNFIGARLGPARPVDTAVSLNPSGFGRRSW
jgi:hypothetical protein